MVRIIFLVVLFSNIQQPSFILKQKKLQLENGAELRYSILTPSTLPRNKTCPLVIALHWGWDRTDSLPPPWFGKGMLTSLIEPAFSESNAIMVAPDCPSGRWDNPVSENALIELMDQITHDFRIDTSRVIIAGFSAGGIGTWYIGSRHPDIFSMAVPMACKPEEEWIDGWKDLPVLIIHGTRDELFNYSDAERILNILTGKNVKTKLLKVENASHYDTGKFIIPLKYSYSWLNEIIN